MLIPFIVDLTFINPHAKYRSVRSTGSNPSKIARSLVDLPSFY